MLVSRWYLYFKLVRLLSLRMPLCVEDCVSTNSTNTTGAYYMLSRNNDDTSKVKLIIESTAIKYILK